MKMKKEYYMLLLALVILVIALLFKWKSIFPEPQIEPTPTPSVSPTLVTPSPTETPSPTPTKIVYDNVPPTGYTHFFELQPVVNGQQVYIAYPKEIDPLNQPKAVVYYHGSGQQITKNFSEQVMKNMRAYGAYLTERNMVFIASNQHGDNYGKAIAIDDTVKALDYVKGNYPLQTRYYVLGFSMGGMPALRHIIMHPNLVDKLALLAPVNDIEHYSASEKTTLAKMPIKIWHGTKDTNVPYWATEALVKGLAPYKPNLVVVTLPGKIHWDVDTEYMNEVYEFYVMK